MQEHLTEPFRRTSHPRRDDTAGGNGPKMSIMGDAPRLVPWLLAVLGPAIAFTVAWPDVSGFAGRFQTVARVAGAEWFVVGLAFWASAAVGLVRAWRADELCTHGAYGLCRHPIFAWWVLFVLPSVALFFDAWPFFVAAVGVWLIVRPAMRSEDAYVARRFPEEHAVYRTNVRPLWPLPYLHTLTPRRLAAMALFAAVLVGVGVYAVALLR